MKTIRKRKICMLNGMKYDSKLKMVVAKHSDGTENNFCLSDIKNRVQRNEEFKKTIKLAREMKEK